METTKIKSYAKRFLYFIGLLILVTIGRTFFEKLLNSYERGNLKQITPKQVDLQTVELPHLTIRVPEMTRFIEKEEKLENPAFHDLIAYSKSYTLSSINKTEIVYYFENKYKTSDIEFDEENSLLMVAERLRTNLNVSELSSNIKDYKAGKLYEGYYKTSTDSLRFLIREYIKLPLQGMVIAIYTPNFKHKQDSIIYSAQFNY